MSKNAQVTKAWSDVVGRPVNYELKEVTTHDGKGQTQLINTDTRSIVVAVNLTGQDAVDSLVKNAGAIIIDDAFTQPEVDGPGSVVNVDNKNPERFGAQQAPVDNVVPEDSADVSATEKARAEQDADQKKAEAKAQAEQKAADDKKAKEEAAEAQKKADADAKARQESTSQGSNAEGANGRSQV